MAYHVTDIITLFGPMETLFFQTLLVDVKNIIGPENPQVIKFSHGHLTKCMKSPKFWA